MAFTKEDSEKLNKEFYELQEKKVSQEEIILTTEQAQLVIKTMIVKNQKSAVVSQVTFKDHFGMKYSCDFILILKNQKEKSFSKN